MANPNDREKLGGSSELAAAGALLAMVFAPLIIAGALLVGQLIAPRKKKRSIID